MRLAEHQHEAVEFVLAADRQRDRPPARGLWDEQGTGKTPAACAVLGLRPHWPAVVATKKGLLRNWATELRRWAGRDSLIATTTADALAHAKQIVTGPRAAPPVLVLSHDLLDRTTRSGWGPVVDLLERGTYFVLDEAHAAKGGGTGRGQAAGRAQAAVARGWGLGLWVTATPMPCSPMDVWVQTCWMGIAEQVFGTPAKFVEHFGGRSYMGRWHWPVDVPEGPLEQLAGWVLRRRRRDVLPSLPPKQHVIVEVPVEGAARRLLDAVAAAASTALGVNIEEVLRREESDAATGLALEIRKRLEAITEARMLIAEAKIPAVLRRIEALEQEGETFAVYSDHLAPIDMLADRPGWVVVRGQETSKQREAAVQAFSAAETADGRPVWGIGYTGALREGANLPRARRLLKASMCWAADGEDQAEDRLMRFGRETDAVIETFVCGHPVELLQQRVIGSKRRRAEQAIDACSGPAGALSQPNVSAEFVPQWLSHTRLQLYRDCRFAHWLRYVVGVRSTIDAEGKRMGILTHAGAAGRLRMWAAGAPGGILGPDAEEAAKAEIVAECRKHRWPQNLRSTEHDGRDALLLSGRMLERFGFTTDRWEPYSYNGKPAIEFELRVPLSEHLPKFAGLYARLDLVAYDRLHRGGTNRPRLTALDFKCKQTRVSSGLSDGADDHQLLIYLAGCRRAGIPTELASRAEVIGKLPEEPALLQNRKKPTLSTSKSLVTDGLMYRQAIKRRGLNEADYAEHLKWLDSEGPRLYSMTECGRTEAAQERVWGDACYDAFEMSRDDVRVVRNLRSYATAPCQSAQFPCEYKEICTATLGGTRDPERYADDLVQLGRMRRSTGAEKRQDDPPIEVVDEMEG